MVAVNAGTLLSTVQNVPLPYPLMVLCDFATYSQSLNVLQYGEGRRTDYRFSVLPVTAILESEKGLGQRCVIILDTGHPTQNYRQRNAFKIKDVV